MTIGKIIGLSGALLGLAGAVPAGIDQRVLIVDTAGAPATLGGGTQYADGGTQANPTGNVSLWLDTSNVLRATSAAKPFPVNIVAGAGSGVSITDSAAWTAATSVFVPGGGVFNDSAAALTAGQQGTQRLTAARGAHSNLRTTAGGDPLLTNNNAAPAALSNLGVAGAVANAAVPSWTEGNQVLLSTNLSGALRSAVEGPTANGGVVTRPPVLVAGQNGGNIKLFGLDSVGGITQGAANAGGTVSWFVQGAGAAGSAIAGNPVQVGGSDGTNSRALLMDTSGRPILGAGIQTIGNVGGLTKNVDATLTRPANQTPYAANDEMTDTGGGIQTITSVATATGGSGIITHCLLSCSSNASTKPQLTVYVYDTTSTPATDNGLFAPSDGVQDTCIGSFQLNTAEIGDATSNTGNFTMDSGQIHIPYVTSGSANLFFRVKVNNVYTAGTNSDTYRFRWTAQQDAK